MIAVNMLDAKTNLSKYVASVSSGREPFVVILRSGTPVAKIVPFEASPSKRIGIAQGMLPTLSLEDFNSINVVDDFVGEGEL